MTRDEILAIAQKHDPQAEWASDDPDENVLLIERSAAVFLLDRDPDAYEIPDVPGLPTEHTRIGFPLTYRGRS